MDRNNAQGIENFRFAMLGRQRIADLAIVWMSTQLLISLVEKPLEKPERRLNLALLWT